MGVWSGRPTALVRDRSLAFQWEEDSCRTRPVVLQKAEGRRSTREVFQEAVRCSPREAYNQEHLWGVGV